MPIYNPNQYPSETFFNGLHVYSKRGPLVSACLESSYRQIESLLNEWHNLYAFRFDLHFPQNTYDWNTAVISRFMPALESRLKAEMLRRGLPVECGKPQYIWTREKSQSENYHYHVFVFLNGDVINSSGHLYGQEWTLKKAVIEAWASALGLGIDLVKGLPHFPDNCDYIVNSRSLDFLQQLANLFYRVSYFAKADTKEADNGARSFTCSHVNNAFLSFTLENLMNWHKEEVLVLSRDVLLVSDEVDFF